MEISFEENRNPKLNIIMHLNLLEWVTTQLPAPRIAGRAGAGADCKPWRASFSVLLLAVVAVGALPARGAVTGGYEGSQWTFLDAKQVLAAARLG